MELRILWTDTAIEQLESIFDYYSFKANTKVARDLVLKIVERTIQLKNQPDGGQKEELLLNRKNDYRYIVEGNYKIIYWGEKNCIKIASIFDTRQNPKKLSKI